MSTKIGKHLNDISNTSLVLDIISEFKSTGYALVMKLEEHLQMSEFGMLPDDPITYKRLAYDINEPVMEVMPIVDKLKETGYLSVKGSDEKSWLFNSRILDDIEQSRHVSKIRSEAANSRETPGRKKKPDPVYSEEFKAKYKQFLDMVNEAFDRKYKGDKRSKQQFHARTKEGYSMDDFKKAIANIKQTEYHQKTNYNYATPEFVSREPKLVMYLNAKTKQSISVQLGKRLGDE